MTDDNLLDQTVCNLPFEVVTIYDNGSQILEPNSNSNLPPSVNVKIRIRNKEDIERRGIISVPRLTAINWPKRVRLANSAQTIMSFNLALEPNSDEAQKKSNRRLLKMFRPGIENGGCLSNYRDEDGYSYMPSISNELKRKSVSGMEDYERGKTTGTFALKKNDFSSSYTNTLKAPKTFLGKCKPGGCLDPPFSEDKYTYKPTIEDAQPIEHQVIDTNSLQPDINIMDVKHKSATQDQKQNILLNSYPDTEILENTARLVTYPSNLSSTKLKTKDSQNKKTNLRMGEQIDSFRKLTNELPEAYFVPTRKEKSKNGKSYGKYDYEEKEPKLKEAYINKDYILKSQTPSELLSDALTITSQSFDEPLKEKQIIRELNTTTPLLIKSTDLLKDNTSKDKVKTMSTKVSDKDENSFKQENPSDNNNISIIQKTFSNIKESENILYINNSRSSIEVDTIQETAEDNNYKKDADPSINVDFDVEQHSIHVLKLSNKISTTLSKGSIDKTRRASLDNFEIREQNNIPKQHQNLFNNVVNKDEIPNIKQQMELRSEEKNNINPLKVKKSGSVDYEYYNYIRGRGISNEIMRDDTNRETEHQKSLISLQRRGDEKSNNVNQNISEQMLENITETTKLLVQDVEYKDNNKSEESVDQETDKPTKQIVDVYPSVTSDILPKVTSSHSVDRILSLTKSHSVLTSQININENQKNSLLDNESSKLTHLTNEKTDTYNDKHIELKKRFDTVENTLSLSLMAGYSSPQKTEIDTINAFKKSHEISSKHDELGEADTIIPKILQLSGPIQNNITLNNQDNTKSHQSLIITTTMKTSKDTSESIETFPQLRQEFSNSDSLKYRKSLNYSTNKEETSNFDTSINDSKLLLTNLKPDTNISKKDIFSVDKLHKPFNELINNNITSLQPLPNPIFLQESDQGFDTVLEGVDKSELVRETYEKKFSKDFGSVQKNKIIDPTKEIKKLFTNDKKNTNSISSVALNFGFRTFTNDKTGHSIETFDPSISLSSYPQDKIVTVKKVLRKNDSEIKIEIDSETDLIMQIKPTWQLNGSRKLASKILNGYKNDRRTDKIRISSSELLISKEKLLQETLKTVYETLSTTEKNIIKLKEEAESLYREQLLLKKVLFSKEIKSNRIIPNTRTCSCLQREIGLE